ncbi:Holliday junction resolvase RuvX [Candidatus Margulisiibacteriota bacterium]
MHRILGLDYGEKRIGVAVSDLLGLTAQPLMVISDISELEPILKRYEQVDKIIVGLPKRLSGEIGPAGQKVLAFMEQLKSKLALPVEIWDERLTTAAAEKTLISAGLSRQKRKKVIDKSAAALILQSYLDSKR